MRLYQNILVGIDVHGPNWEKPFQKACAYAKNQDATLHIATVLNIKANTIQDRPDQKSEKIQNDAYEVLENYQQKAKAKGVSHVNTILNAGSPQARITRHLTPEYDIDLIIIGATRENRMENVIVGSVANAIVREARCDVLTVR
ncbi:universal stress protein [Salicibibacter halophilus]|nr:universal stress protein [Salicibibacter halophilus]